MGRAVRVHQEVVAGIGWLGMRAGEAKTCYDYLIGHVSRDKQFESVTKYDVVRDAQRNKKSPLRRFFGGFNARKAAEERWLEVADLVLRTIYQEVEIVKGKTVQFRALPNVIHPTTGERVFMPFDKAAQNPETRLELVMRVLDDMEGAVGRARVYEELVPIANVYDAVKARMVSKLKKKVA